MQIKKLLLIVITASLISWDTPKPNDFKTLFETSNGKQSAPYAEGIAWWQTFADAFDIVSMQEFGMTDAGLPLHTLTLSKERRLLSQLKASDKTIILINNAIHPGEPDGVDASMLLYRDLVMQSSNLLDSCILICIPYYNIGGALNRNSTTRANQDGPEEYGFRGNAQNLDLNRDFVKCDSRNAESFAKLLQLIDPDVYIETHVSNGADYQYTMTYLSTQPDKLGYAMGNHLRSSFIPELEQKMRNRGNEMVPYVNHHSGPLKNSYNTFYDSPRYSSGLTTLHNIYGFITETHMLKPFKARVRATYDYLLCSVEYGYEHKTEIKSTRATQKTYVAESYNYAIDWEVDQNDFAQFQFKGYEYGYKKSEVTGADRLFYDKSKPVTKRMFYRDRMKPTRWAQKPKAYILKRGYTTVEDRLRWNGVKLQELTTDTTIEVVTCRITSYETKEQPYEKHYLHYNTKVEYDTISYSFLKGDYLIETGTDKDRFLVEVFHPSGPDSYFNWNFFDAILQQKEWYSSYVFEDRAAALLKQNPKLRDELEMAKSEAKDKGKEMAAEEILYWVYRHSPHYEKEHNRLPIFEVI